MCTKSIIPKLKLGILGGMGPLATAEFLKILSLKSPAKKDQEHPIMYILSDPQIPDRTDAILKKGLDPTDKIKTDILSLVKMGADIIAVPCNTAHYFIDNFLNEIPTEFIHIISETVKVAKKNAAEGSWLISSLGTRNCGLYQKYASLFDYSNSIFIPTDDIAEKIQTCSNLIKSNQISNAKLLTNEITQSLWGIRDIPLLVACTEFPLAYNELNLPPHKMISCLNVLADACIERLYQ